MQRIEGKYQTHTDSQIPKYNTKEDTTGKDSNRIDETTAREKGENKKKGKKYLM